MPQQEEATISVGGMDCASCVAHVEKAARRVAGVSDAAVNLARGRAVVRFDPARTDAGAVAEAITSSGYPAHTHSDHGNAEEQRVAEHAAHARAWLRRAVVGIALWLPVELLHWTLSAASASHGMWLIWVALVTSTISVGYIGWAFYRSAWRAL